MEDDIITSKQQSVGWQKLLALAAVAAHLLMAAECLSSTQWDEAECHRPSPEPPLAALLLAGINV